MVYETFRENLRSKLQDRLGGECLLLPQKIHKNNGQTADGLAIRPKGRGVAPTICLGPYYERFREGCCLDELADEIATVCMENSAMLREDFSMLKDFSRIRDKVVYRLVHTLSNRELLAEVPSVPYLDLSIVFYLYLGQDGSGQMTALIQKKHLRMWDTSPDELYALACANTRRLLPARLRSMAQVIRDMAGEPFGKELQEDLAVRLLPPQGGELPMFVLSNPAGLNGASAILYPRVLREIAGALREDLVIIPSSVHEVLLVPLEDGANLPELSEMVVTVNREQVAPEDRLSNHVYLYSRETDEVRIAPNRSPDTVF